MLDIASIPMRQRTIVGCYLKMLRIKDTSKEPWRLVVSPFVHILFCIVYKVINITQMLVILILITYSQVVCNNWRVCWYFKNICQLKTTKYIWEIDNINHDKSTKTQFSSNIIWEINFVLLKGRDQNSS